MSKTLSAAVITIIDGQVAKPVRVATITFADGFILYVTGQTWGDAGSENVHNGQTYDVAVQSWGTIQQGRIDPMTYEVEPGSASFNLFNSIPLGGADNFTDMFEAHPPHYAVVTISEFFENAYAADDAEIVFRGVIENVINITLPTVTVQCSDYDTILSNKFAVEILDTTTFASADPDDVGKMLPVVYGSAKRAPFLGIDVGALSTLSEAITAASTTIKLSDTTNFPSSGTVIIDQEEIVYTGKSGDSLTGCTRDGSAGESVGHDRGALVGEKQSEYVFAAGCICDSIGDVYIRDVKQESSGYTAYTGKSGDEHATYTGRAVIAFSSLPRVYMTSPDATFDTYRESTTIPLGHAKILDDDGYLVSYDDSTTITFQTAPSGTLTNIYVEYEFEFRTFGTPSGYMEFFIDGVLVGSYDGSALTEYVTSPLIVKKSSWPTSATKTKSWRTGGNEGVTLTVTSARVYCTTTVDDHGQRGKMQSLRATNEPLGKFTSGSAADAGTSLTFPTAPAGTLSDIEITYTWYVDAWGSALGYGAPHVLTIDGINVASIASDGTITQLMPTTFTIRHATWQTAITKTASRLDSFRRGESFVVMAVQTCFSTTFDYAVQLSGGSNSMADAVLGGRVSADVDGIPDDGSGTYTGTPGALIERPDHILKHIFVSKCGLTDPADSTSYAASGSFYSTGSYALAVVIAQKPSVRALVNRIAHQAKSIEFWDSGSHFLIAIQSASTAKFIDEMRIDEGQAWLTYTDRYAIQNTLTAGYARDWSGYADNVEADQSIVTASDADSVTKYGTLEGERRSYAYITGETQAQAVLDWEKDDLKDTRMTIEFVGGYYLHDIVRGDLIKFRLEYGGWLDRATAYQFRDFVVRGIDTFIMGDTDQTEIEHVIGTRQFRVIENARRPDFKIQIKAIGV